MDCLFCSLFNYFISIAVIILTCVYLFFKYTFSYWDRRGIKYVQPIIPYGNFEKTFKQTKSAGQVVSEIYKNTNEPFIGIFGAFRPILVICDPQLIRQILIKDFHHFVDRGVYSDEKRDPLSAHLFAISGDRWKNLRTKLTPTFTSGKLKAMFSTLVDCGTSLRNVIANAAEKNEEVDVRELVACYSTNIIASVAFGLDIDSIENPNTPFRKYGRQFFRKHWRNGIRNFAKFVSPNLMHLLRLKFIDTDIEEFFFDMVKQTLDLREKHNVVRKDFFQLLIQLRNTGNVQLDGEWATTITKDEKSKKLTFNELAAQAFVFYAAGFETSSTTISFCLFELAKNLQIQGKAQEEVDTILKKHDGQFTYDSVNEMKYLESCIDETLRKHTPVNFLNRECTKEYKLPGTDIILEKGTALQIPVYGLHHDERYYPNPDEFNPDRFYDGTFKSKTFIEMPYLPFGDGPRNCIGMRMGIMEAKVCLAMMLKNFNYELGDQHIGKELEYSPTSFVAAPTSSIMLKVTKRK